ncbi:MAG: imidazolonepropionase [Alicyclobacillus sp. RIFOXYA1_FULL_53_8]|nr:MAG: imidazolonepropionase [Alicyclobacillus sp. RIFOXYA1_FULL_53_8]
MDLIIVNARLATLAGGEGPKRGQEMKNVRYVEDGVLGIREGRIQFVGSRMEAQAAGVTAVTGAQTWDAKGRLVTPGLVDPHTHLVHGGSRENELAMKQAGKAYLEILAAGGGILSTVRSTRAASEEELLEQAAVSLRRMLEQGATTVEAKSGYGLDRDTELKQLRVAKQLNSRQPVELVSTFLGPHAIPTDYKGRADEFLDEMTTLLDEIREQGLAEFADIFCEEGVFSVEQSRRFLEAAKAKGFGLKIHADEIESLGGAELAAELGAVSADHLPASSPAGLKALADAGVVAVLLPGTSWNLRAKQHAKARYLIDEAQAAVALATDYNPGSCPTESLQLIMAFAVNLLGMTPEEVLTAVTRNAAYAIGRGDVIGSLEVGKQADICIWNTTQLAYIPYHFGVNHIAAVFKKGVPVVRDGKMVEEGEVKR